MIFDRHIYVNSFLTVICHILSLVVYVFCKPFRNPTDRALLFDVTRCEKQFSDLFAHPIAHIRDGDKMLLEARPEVMRTHSTRKVITSIKLVLQFDIVFKY